MSNKGFIPIAVAMYFAVASGGLWLITQAIDGNDIDAGHENEVLFIGMVDKDVINKCLKSK